MDILRAISGKPWRWVHWGEMDGVTWDKYGPGAPGNPVFALEEFSTSLDAALTLVPEGCDWDVGSITGNSGATAHVMFPAIIDGERAWIMRGTSKGMATPALALCIAALRAREQQP